MAPIERISLPTESNLQSNKASEARLEMVGSQPVFDEPEITEKRDDTEEISEDLLGVEMGLSHVLFNYDEELEAAVLENFNAISKIPEPSLG